MMRPVAPDPARSVKTLRFHFAGDGASRYCWFHIMLFIICCCMFRYWSVMYCR